MRRKARSGLAGERWSVALERQEAAEAAVFAARPKPPWTALIAVLDALDGDPDLEPEETDEDAGEQNEVDADQEEGDGDADGEPSLGSVSDVSGGYYGVELGPQLRWGFSSTDDLEDDPAEKHACADGDAVLEQYGIAHYSGARESKVKRTADRGRLQRPFGELTGLVSRASATSASVTVIRRRTASFDVSPAAIGPFRSIESEPCSGWKASSAAA